MNALSVSGSTVYAGGLFSNIGASRATAAPDATGAATWNPSPDGIVSPSRSTVRRSRWRRLGVIDGQARSYLAALDAATGNATSWDPSLNGSTFGSVRLPCLRGRRFVFKAVERLYLAGDLHRRAHELGSKRRQHSPLPRDGPSAIYAGGTFRAVGTSAQSYIAGFTGVSTAVEDLLKRGIACGALCVVGGPLDFWAHLMAWLLWLALEPAALGSAGASRARREP